MADAPHYSICSVSFLNPVPLIWGMINGPQKRSVNLSFEIPSVCAEIVRNGRADAGLVPVAEIARQNLAYVPTIGISCLGNVRSILLISKVPFAEIRTLAADNSSRTSIELARVVLRERYGVQPEIVRRDPVLNRMLTEADAALIIGDPALHIDPQILPYRTLDLGNEWQQLTGLPFVFALWAGKSISSDLADLLQASYAFGADHLDDIVESEYGRRSISRELADRYLRHHIHYRIGEQELKGLQTFWELAGLQTQAQPVRSFANSTS